MDLRQMELFVAVAEAGSLHAAARRMYISQPAVSQAMRKLENTVGVTLLIRTTRGIDLSPAGSALLGHARTILSSVDSALSDARRVGRRQRLVVGVLAGHLGAGELTPVIIGEYRRAHPEIEVSLVDLSFADQFSAVQDGRVDVGIVRAPELVRGFEYVPLFNEPRLLCFGTDAEVPMDPDAVSIESALSLPVLNMSSTPESWARYWALEDFRRPSARISTPAVTISELQSALAGSRCAVSVAQSGWRMAIRNPLLRAIPIGEASESQCQVAYTSESDMIVGRFADFAQQVVAENISMVEGATLAA